MSKKATEFQRKAMSRMYRGKEIFKPLNTGWIDENVACVREWVANIFFYRKGDTTIKNKTVLIIAHRMRTVAGADHVVVLSGGIVAEQGSPAELYAKNGLYTHMMDLQSASQNWTI